MGLINKEEIEFLRENNAIEGEYSKRALFDAVKAWEYAKSRNKINSHRQVLHIHKLLMGGLRPDIAGKFRDVAVSIGGEIKPIPQKGELKSLLEDLLTNCKCGGHVQIKNFHILFEKLHPFEDGNGRVGRIIMNVQRIHAGLPILIIHEGEQQQRYYQWFR